MPADMRKGKSLFATTSNSFGTGEGVTITPNDVAGLPTGNIVLTFDREVTGKVERIKGAISGSNFVVASGGRGYDGTTEQAHTSPNVEYIYNGADQNDAVDAFTAEHSVAGVHDVTKVGMLAGTQTFTGNKTFSGTTALTTADINGGTVDGVTIATSRINPRTTTETSSATPTINTDNTDIHTITALATAITSMTTNLSGTPVNGQKLIIRIKDDGTARGITWGASFASRGATLPTTTVLGKYQYNGFIWNSTTSTWDLVATVNEA